jgi:hypothetical protein
LTICAKYKFLVQIEIGDLIESSENNELIPMVADIMKSNPKSRLSAA